MSFIRKLAFRYFAYAEEKKLKISVPWWKRFFNLFSKKTDVETEKPQKNDLNQPKPESKKDKNKALATKIGIWAGILIFIGVVVGLISYYATRPKDIIVPQDALAKIVWKGADNKSGVIGEPDGNTQANIQGLPIQSAELEIFSNLASYQAAKTPLYTVPLLPKNIVRSYESTNYKVWLETPSSNLPIVINISYNNSGPVTTINILNLTLTYNLSNIQPGATQTNALITFFNSRVLNTTTFPPSQTNWWVFLVNLIPIIFFIIIIVIYMRMMKKQGLGNDSIFSIGKSNAKNTKTNVRFSDVAGIAEVKEELMEVVDYIKRPQKYAAMGARSPRGLILYGPPGTGKTLIAKAVAGEANCNFFPIAGSSFEDMLVGVGAKRVRDLFQKARKESPSIIFIDEIDSVASKRGKNDIVGGAGGVADQTINQLLAEMDGFTTTSGVVVIAATNRLDVLDEAILRPGRFDRQIQVSLPDISERLEILKIHARNKNLSSKVVLLDIARRTPGFSGAQLENVLNEATLLAVRQNRTTVSMENLDEAIDRTIGGPQRKARVMTEEEKKQISYHEAGHALVGLHTPGTDVVQKITIIPRGNAAGYTLQTPQEQERQVQTKTELLNQVRMTLGGRAAEEIVFGENNISTGAANDLYKVSNIVRSMVTQLGMSDLGLTQYVPSEGQQPFQKLFSEQTNTKIDDTIHDIIDKEYLKAKEIISKNRHELDLIVETLLVLETILKDQIDYIHKYLALPPEVEEKKKDLEKAKDEAKADDPENLA